MIMEINDCLIHELKLANHINLKIFYLVGASRDYSSCNSSGSIAADISLDLVLNNCTGALLFDTQVCLLFKSCCVKSTSIFNTEVKPT